MENLRRNSMFYRLLFNELAGGLSFNYFLEQKTGISFNKVVGELKSFHNILQHMISSNISFLLCIDHLYENLWKDNIPGEHEQHTVIVYNYDPQTREYLLIDQDYSKDYFSVNNLKQRMEYCKCRISKDKLYTLASHAYEAFSDDSDLDSAHFLFYVPNNAICSDCTWEVIEKDFKQLICNVANNMDLYEKEISKGINDVLNDFYTFKRDEQINYNYKYIWLHYDGYKTPKEIQLLFWRATTLKMYKIFYEHVGFHIDPHNEIILQQLHNVIAFYDLCKNTLRKSVYINDVSPCKRLPLIIPELIAAERTLYIYMK